jgi:hypothetical protein
MIIIYKGLYNGKIKKMYSADWEKNQLNIDYTTNHANSDAFLTVSTCIHNQNLPVKQMLILP